LCGVALAVVAPNARMSPNPMSHSVFMLDTAYSPLRMLNGRKRQMPASRQNPSFYRPVRYGYPSSDEAILNSAIIVR
jgi:hypothetical protein